MKFTIYQNSRQGQRPYNEDRLAYSYSKESVLLVLADGMGGYRHGEIAAQVTIQTFTDAFQQLAKPSLTNPAKFLTDHIQQAHDLIIKLTETEELIESPRTTIVIAIIQHGHLYCAHLGDSRLYHLRGKHLLFRTEDHSIVQSLFNQGLISKEHMATHPHKNRIHNCVGSKNAPKIDLANRMELVKGDTVMLCSDGVWGPLKDKDIISILNEGLNVTDATNKIMDAAETAINGNGDNLSAITLQWGDKQSSQDAISTQQMLLDGTTTMINPITTQSPDDSIVDPFSDDDIEKRLAKIQAALIRSKSK